MTTLCLIDPPVISFDKLNVLRYGSDEFNNKINKEITGVAGGGAWTPNFLCNKNKKGKQREKRVSKQKLSKGCHQGENVTVLVMFTVFF